MPSSHLGTPPFPTLPTGAVVAIVAEPTRTALLPRIYLLRGWVNRASLDAPGSSEWHDALMVERSSENVTSGIDTGGFPPWSWTKDRRSLWHWQNGGLRLFGRETCYREAASSRWAADRWGRCPSPGPRAPSAQRAKPAPRSSSPPPTARALRWRSQTFWPRAARLRSGCRSAPCAPST